MFHNAPIYGPFLRGITDFRFTMAYIIYYHS
jgi:hypothetical protein